MDFQLCCNLKCLSLPPSCQPTKPARDKDFGWREQDHDSDWNVMLHVYTEIQEAVFVETNHSISHWLFRPFS